MCTPRPRGFLQPESPRGSSCTSCRGEPCTARLRQGQSKGATAATPHQAAQTLLPGGWPTCIPLLQSPGLPTNLGKKRSNSVPPHPAPPSPPTLSSSSTPSPTPNYTLNSSWDLSPVCASPGSTEPGPRASRSLGLPWGPWLRVHRALRIPFVTRKPPKGKSPRHHQAQARVSQTHSSSTKGISTPDEVCVVAQWADTGDTCVLLRDCQLPWF